MKCLIIGDLHTKLSDFKRIEYFSNQEPFDKIIFLGDYCDDWNTPSQASLILLQTLVDFQLQRLNKVILLLGNHDLSEWQANKFRCSGFNEYTHSLVKPFFDQNIQHFQITYLAGDYLLSHAGFTNNYIEDLERFDISPTQQGLDQSFNWALQNKDKDERANQIFNTLSHAGKERGGVYDPSCVWADKKELEDVPQFKQIVGHTPVATIQTIGNVTFCDTFSTYPTVYNLALPIGDSTVLVLDTESKNLETRKLS